MIPDAKLEPDYVYEENPPEVDEIQCPEHGTEGEKIACFEWMNRTELLAHYLKEHPQYWGTEPKDIDIHFEQERSRRYGR